MIIEMIQEWFKELLIDGIISNLSGTFDTVNTKVGEIAGEVGMTPAGWNGGIFNMIRGLSETVIVPPPCWSPSVPAHVSPCPA